MLVKNFRKISTQYSQIVKYYSGTVPNTQTTTIVKDTPDALKELIKNSKNISPDIIKKAERVGADLFLTPEKLKTIEKASFQLSDLNENFDKNMLPKFQKDSFMLKYLRNMGLIHDYNEVFRTFLQVIAQEHKPGLDLVTEKRLATYIESVVANIRHEGYLLDLSDIKILQEYSILRVELYKNLKGNRFENGAYNEYSFNNVTTPLGSCTVATRNGDDISYFKNNRPYILATIMHIKTPMKLRVFNQNLSRKLHGGEEGEIQDYVVRFESELNLNDFAWVLNTQNKPNRLRHTKIADFNNALRSNPFFLEKFDLKDDNKRFTFMSKSDALDSEVAKTIRELRPYVRF
jgi:hypothetical protein